MQILLTSGVAVFQALDARQEAENLAQYNLPVPDQFKNANSFLNPLGEAPAKAWVLLDREALDAINKDVLVNFTLADDGDLITQGGAGAGIGELSSTGSSGGLAPIDGGFNQITLYNWVFVKALCLTPGNMGDADAAYLCEFADKRWLCQNPLFEVPINRQYNVRAPAFGGAFYVASQNAGVDWTWATMIGDIWSTMAGQLGAFPGIPITPDGTPEGWRFPGVSAWQALSTVLWRIGCAVRCDLSVATGQFTVVQVGGLDAILTFQLGLLESRKVHDIETVEATRGRVPYGVRVFFHKIMEHYGTEQTTPRTDVIADGKQYSTDSVYNIDVVGPDSATAEVGIYHPIWDDLPAIMDVTGALTNGAALTARATESANDFYRMLKQGGSRFLRIYSGVANVQPSEQIKGVAWRQTSNFDDDWGLVTEIIRHPHRMLQVGDNAQFCECCGDSAQDRAPDYRPTFPVYPHLLQIIRVVDATKDGDGLMDAFVQQPDPAGTYLDREACWAQDANAATDTTQRYHGRLIKYQTGRPVYAIVASAVDDNNPFPVVTNVCPQLNTGEDILDADYSIVAALGTYAEVGPNFEIVLPTVGTYSLDSDVAWSMNIDSTSAGFAFMVAKLRNVTDSVDVPNTERTLFGTDLIPDVTTSWAGTAPIQKKGYAITSAPKTIRLYAKRDGSGAAVFNSTFIASNSNGRTVLGWQREVNEIKVEYSDFALPNPSTVYCIDNPEDCCACARPFALGTASGILQKPVDDTILSLTIPNVTMKAGDMLIIVVGLSGPFPDFTNIDLTYNGTPAVTFSQLATGAPPNILLSKVSYLQILTDQTGDITLTFTFAASFTTAVSMAAIRVIGVDSVPDVNFAQATGVSTNPNSSSFTMAAPTAGAYIQTLVVTDQNPIAFDGAWQDKVRDRQHAGDATVFEGDDVRVRLCEGYRVAATPPSTFRAEKTGLESSPAPRWHAHAVAFPCTSGSSGGQSSFFVFGDGLEFEFDAP